MTGARKRTRYVTVRMTEVEANAVIVALDCSDAHPRNDEDGSYREMHRPIDRGQDKIQRAVWALDPAP